ncbi:SAM-dependent methyltransferase [Streptomyces californicus]|uniref:SAM-dependent methyltransferase n=1 Tax=Streptomyces californicus TaxID=67351 RepID=UPI0037B2B747
MDSASSTRAMRWLMGEQCQTLPADRQLARKLQRDMPWLEMSLLINRSFHFSSAAYFSQRLDIGQFITLSAGPYRPWPGPDAEMQPPCAAVPDAEFVHVYALTGTGEGGTPCAHRHLQAGLHQMLGLLHHPALEALDRRRPIGVLADDIGPLSESTADLRFGLDVLREWLPPGSAIALTHTTTDLLPAGRRAGVRARHDHAAKRARATGGTYQPRSLADVKSLLGPWPLLRTDQPVATGAFFPDHAYARLPEHHSGAYAAIALHPQSLPSAGRRAAGTLGQGQTSRTEQAGAR